MGMLWNKIRTSGFAGLAGFAGGTADPTGTCPSEYWRHTRCMRAAFSEASPVSNTCQSITDFTDMVPCCNAVQRTWSRLVFVKVHQLLWG